MVCLGAVRIEADSFRAVSDRLVEVAVPETATTSRAICFGHHRIKLYGFVTVGDGLAKFTFSQVSMCPAGVSPSILWIETNGLGVCGYCSIEIALAMQQIALLRCFIFWVTYDEFSFSRQE